MTPYKHKVQYYETDKMRITHHSNYIRFMEEARLDFLEQLGWGYDKMEESGIISPVISVSCDYRKTTTYPDVIVIEVSVLECSGVKLKLGYTMTVEDKIVCQGTSTHCFLNTQGQLISYAKQYPELFGVLVKLRDTAAE